MSVANKNFSVVQFIKKPFVGMDDYVCVPNVLVALRPTKHKVIVAYNPFAYHENGEYFHKKYHAKKKEKYGDKNNKKWKLYTANLKYETDVKSDAERWIAKRKDQVLTDVEDSNMMRDAQSEPVLDKKLRSSSRNSTLNFNAQMTEKLLENSREHILKKKFKRVQSEPKEELKKKRPKLAEAAKSTCVDYANPTPGCSKTEELTILPNFQLILSDQTEKTAAASSGRKTTTKKITKPRITKENKSVARSDSKNTRHSTTFKQANKQGEKQPSPVPDCKQAPSMPLLDVDEPMGVINSDKEIQPESITEQIPPSSQIPSHASQVPCQPEYVQKRKTSVELCPDNLLPVSRTQEVSVRQSKETNRHGQTTHLHDNTMAARTTALTTKNQFSQLYQDTDTTKNMPSTSNHLPNSVKLSSRLFFNNITRKPSLTAPKNPVDKKMNLENIISNMLVNSGQNSSNSTDKSSSILTRSVTRQAPLATQNQSQDGPRVQEMHAKNHTERNGNDQNELNSIDHKTIHQDIANNTSAVPILTNLAHQPGGFVQQSIARQDLQTQEYCLQENARKKDILRTNNVIQSTDHTVHFQETVNEAFAAQNRSNQANQPGEFLIRRSTEINNTEHRPPPQNSRVPSAEQNSSNVSNQFHRGFEQEIKLPTNHHYSQRDPRLTRTRDVDISMKTNSKSQSPGPQEVTTRTPPTGLPKASNSMGQSPAVYKHNSLEDSQTQASLSRSTEQNNINVAAVPQNITTEPSLFMHNGKMPPTYSFHHHEIHGTLVHQNHVCQDPRTQKRHVDQPTKTIFTMKRIYYENSISSSAIANSPKLVDSACQTDESLIDEPMSTDQEVVSDNEMCVKTPAEIVNDVNCTVESISPESDPADRPTSGNDQVHPRLIAEQQMLNEFANLFNQMDSTLSYACDMLNNLQSTIVESAETYNRAISPFNALENFMISASPPSSVTSEERRTGEDRENYGSGNDNFNNGVNRAPTEN